jgi:hypothetical protein
MRATLTLLMETGSADPAGAIMAAVAATAYGVERLYGTC